MKKLLLAVSLLIPPAVFAQETVVNFPHIEQYCDNSELSSIKGDLYSSLKSQPFMKTNQYMCYAFMASGETMDIKVEDSTITMYVGESTITFQSPSEGVWYLDKTGGVKMSNTSREVYYSESAIYMSQLEQALAFSASNSDW